MRNITRGCKGKCDLCSKTELTTWYDSPINGRFANTCEACFTGEEPAIRITYKAEPEKINSGEATGIELTSIEAIIVHDEPRDVECPLCQDVRCLEPDAEEYECSCGVTIKCLTEY